jgi:hypothetical protein
MQNTTSFKIENQSNATAIRVIQNGWLFAGNQKKKKKKKSRFLLQEQEYKFESIDD